MLIVKTNDRDIDRFWKSYWQRVPRDPDHISDRTIYPLFPVDEYVRPEWRLLEAGCGMGRVFKHYHYQGRSIIGLEYDRECLGKLRRENPDFPILGGDARALPFKDETFDLVMAFGVVSSIEHGHLEVLRECRRVLRPGGMICASVVSHTPLRRLQNSLSWLRWRLDRLRGREAHRSFHAYAYRPGEWAGTLEREGFRVVRIEPTHSRVLFWEYLGFLRERGVSLEMAAARDGDVGYRLTPLGEFLFQKARRFTPWWISIGIVALARK